MIFSKSSHENATFKIISWIPLCFVMVFSSNYVVYCKPIFLKKIVKCFSDFFHSCSLWTILFASRWINYSLQLPINTYFWPWEEIDWLNITQKTIASHSSHFFEVHSCVYEVFVSNILPFGIILSFSFFHFMTSCCLSCGLLRKMNKNLRGKLRRCSFKDVRILFRLVIIIISSQSQFRI